MYSLQVCPLNRADIQSLDFCVNSYRYYYKMISLIVCRLIVKFFCNNNLSMGEECGHYFIIALLSELLRKHTQKFLTQDRPYYTAVCFYFIYLVISYSLFFLMLPFLVN